MKRWAQHPPSAGRVKLVLAVIAITLVLYGLDRWLGLSKMLDLAPVRRGHVPRF